MCHILTFPSPDNANTATRTPTSTSRGRAHALLFDAPVNVDVYPIHLLSRNSPYREHVIGVEARPVASVSAPTTTKTAERAGVITTPIEATELEDDGSI